MVRNEGYMREPSSVTRRRHSNESGSISSSTSNSREGVKICCVTITVRRLLYLSVFGGTCILGGTLVMLVAWRSPEFWARLDRTHDPAMVGGSILFGIGCVLLLGSLLIYCYGRDLYEKGFTDNTDAHVTSANPDESSLRSSEATAYSAPPSVTVFPAVTSTSTINDKYPVIENVHSSFTPPPPCPVTIYPTAPEAVQIELSTFLYPSTTRNNLPSDNEVLGVSVMYSSTPGQHNHHVGAASLREPAQTSSLSCNRPKYTVPSEPEYETPPPFVPDYCRSITVREPPATSLVPDDRPTSTIPSPPEYKIPPPYVPDYCKAKAVRKPAGTFHAPGARPKNVMSSPSEHTIPPIYVPINCRTETERGTARTSSMPDDGKNNTMPSPPEYKIPPPYIPDYCTARAMKRAVGTSQPAGAKPKCAMHFPPKCKETFSHVHVNCRTTTQREPAGISSVQDARLESATPSPPEYRIPPPYKPDHGSD